MVLGNTMSVMLELEVDISQIAKLKAARKTIDRFQRDTGRSSARMNKLRMATSSALQTVAGLGDKLRAARMAALNLMFTGLNLVFVFGALLAVSPRVRAGFSAIASSLKLVMQEAGKRLLPVLLDVAKWLRNSDDDTRNLISTIAIWGAAIGAVAMILGILLGPLITLFGFITSLAGAFLSIPGAISTVAGWFGTLSVWINTVITTMTTLLGPTLSMILGAFAALAAGIFAGIMIVRKFGNVVGTIVAVVAGILAVLAVAFSAPIWLIVGLIGIVIGAMWAMRDEILKALKKAWKVLKKWAGKLGSILTSLAGTVMSKAKKIGSNIIDGIADKIRAGKDIVIDAINGILPFGISVSDISDMANTGIGAAQSAVSGVTSVNDFVMTPGGQVLDYSPRDFIFGTETPGALGGGGQQQITVNFQEPTIDSEVDMDRLMDRVEDRLERNQRRKNNLL